MLRSLPVLALCLLVGCASSGPVPRHSIEVRSACTPEVHEVYSRAREADPEVQVAFLDFPGMPAQIPILADLPLLRGLFQPTPVQLGEGTWSELVRAAFPAETFAPPYALLEQGNSLVAVQRPEVLDRLQGALDQIYRELETYQVSLWVYHLPGGGDDVSIEELAKAAAISAPRVHVLAGQSASISARTERSYVADYVAVRQDGRTVMDPAVHVVWDGYAGVLLVDAEREQLQLDFELRELVAMQQIEAVGIGTIEVPEVMSWRIEKTLSLADAPACLALGGDRWLRVELRRVSPSN